MVVRSDLGEETQRAFINLFKYAQQFYGQKVSIGEPLTDPLASIKKTIEHRIQIFILNDTFSL